MKRLLLGLAAFAAGAGALILAFSVPPESQVRLRFALWALSFAALAGYAFVAGGARRVPAAALVAASLPFPILLAVGAFGLYGNLYGDILWPAISGVGLVLVALGRWAPALGAWVVVAAQAGALAVGVWILLNDTMSFETSRTVFLVIDSILVAGLLGLALLPVRHADLT